MTDKNFSKFLRDNSWEYNKKTIENLMEKELEKEFEEINMEFVDVCMYYLTGYNENTTLDDTKEKVMPKTKHILFKISRFFIAAAIIVCCISIGITVYATANEISIPDIFVQIFSDRAVVNYSDKEMIERYSNNLDYNPLYDTLSDLGVQNIMLPFDLYGMEYTIERYTSNDSKVSVDLSFENHEISIKINDYQKKKYIQDLEIDGEFIVADKIQVNNIDVYLFEKKKPSGNSVTIITYQINLTQYYISINQNINTAEEFISKNRI